MSLLMLQVREMMELVEEKETKKMIQTEYLHELRQKLDMDKALTVQQKGIVTMKELEISFGQIQLIIGQEITVVQLITTAQ